MNPLVFVFFFNQRASEGQDVVILTAVQTFSSLDTWVSSYEESKVNVHLVYFGVSTTKVDIAQLTRYGSAHFMPNIINNRQMNVYTWAVNTLQSIYRQTKTHRAKVAYTVDIIMSLFLNNSKMVCVRTGF